MPDYLNTLGAAEELGISNPLFCYRRAAIGIAPDAQVIGGDGKRTDVYKRETISDFGARWVTYTSASRQYRADVKRWRASKPVMSDRAEELIAS
jgi:hypothetical protein